MAVGPPVSVAVYQVSLASVTPGFRIHWLVVPFRVTAPATGVRVAVVRSVKVLALTPVTALLNVAVMFAVRLALVALIAGTRAVTVGPADGETPARESPAGCRPGRGSRWHRRSAWRCTGCRRPA